MPAVDEVTHPQFVPLVSKLSPDQFGRIIRAQHMRLSNLAYEAVNRVLELTLRACEEGPATSRGLICVEQHVSMSLYAAGKRPRCINAYAPKEVLRPIVRLLRYRLSLGLVKGTGVARLLPLTCHFDAQLLRHYSTVGIIGVGEPLV